MGEGARWGAGARGGAAATRPLTCDEWRRLLNQHDRALRADHAILAAAVLDGGTLLVAVEHAVALGRVWKWASRLQAAAAPTDRLTSLTPMILAAAVQLADRAAVFELLGSPLNEYLLRAALAKDVRALGALYVPLSQVTTPMAARTMPVLGASKARFHEQGVLSGGNRRHRKRRSWSQTR